MIQEKHPILYISIINHDMYMSLFENPEYGHQVFNYITYNIYREKDKIWNQHTLNFHQTRSEDR